MARRRPDISFPRVNSNTVVFTGGVNEGVTNLELRPGNLFRCLNYEEIDGAFHGYSSIEGFERHDGQPSPSDVQVELLEDFGNDDDTRFLLESGDSEDLYDQSSNSLPVTSYNIEFSEARAKFGEGSWRFFSGADSRINIGQAVSTLDVSTRNFTFDGWFQFSDGLQTCTVFQKSTLYRLKVVNSILTFEFQVNGGPGYNRSIATPTVISANRWHHFSISQYEDSMFLGVDGTVVAVLDLTGDTLDDDSSDFVIGDGLNATMDLYVDSIRYSAVPRIAAALNDPYNYSETNPFSASGLYTVNGDERDREAARALIAEVPGEGPVRDVHIYKGDSIAVRDDVGGVDAGLYKETASGWVEATPDTNEFNFTTSFIPDDTVTPVQGEAWTSSGGATGIMWDYVLESGNPAAGTGVGYCNVIVQTGTLANGETITITSTTNTMVIASVPVVVGLAAGEAVDFQTGRFPFFPPTAPLSEIMYLIGNTPGFFASDANYLVHLRGPEDVTKIPQHIMIFGDRLWLAYEKGHLFYSVAGDPANFSGEFGGGEIFLGDDVQDMVVAPGGTLIVIMRNTIKVIKHNNPSDITVGFPFVVDDFTDKAGGFRHTATSLLGDIYFCDDRGPTSLTAVDTYGDFQLGDLKNKTHLTYQRNKKNVVGAYVQRNKTQYRIFFNDPDSNTTKGIFTTFSEKKVKGATLVEYPVEFSCFEEGEDALGNVKILAGAEDGFVYLMDKGTSFDGEDVTTALTTSYYHYGTPRLWKRFHRILFEISAGNRMQFYFRPDFNYGSGEMSKSFEYDILTMGQGGVWGQSVWGQFIWGGQAVSNSMLYLTGYGYNMSMNLRTSNRFLQPHTIHNMIVDYSNGSRFM